jgi:hypothetical protein
MTLRGDQEDDFALLATGAKVGWMPEKGSRPFFHASTDGARAVCSPKIQVVEKVTEPASTDRSADIRTCQLCAERVRRRKRA